MGLDLAFGKLAREGSIFPLSTSHSLTVDMIRPLVSA